MSPVSPPSPPPSFRPHLPLWPLNALLRNICYLIFLTKWSYTLWLRPFAKGEGMNEGLRETSQPRTIHLFFSRCSWAWCPWAESKSTCQFQQSHGFFFTQHAPWPIDSWLFQGLVAKQKKSPNAPDNLSFQFLLYYLFFLPSIYALLSPHIPPPHSYMLTSLLRGELTRARPKILRQTTSARLAINRQAVESAIGIIYQGERLNSEYMFLSTHWRHLLHIFPLKKVHLERQSSPSTPMLPG